LNDAFKGESDFKTIRPIYPLGLSNDSGKVRVDPYVELLFGEATSNSTDPLVILLRILKDGKLGTLSVNKRSVKISESVGRGGKNYFVSSLSSFRKTGSLANFAESVCMYIRELTKTK